MSSKKFFVLFTELGNLPPRSYKLMRFVQKYKQLYPEYQLFETESEEYAKQKFFVYDIQHKQYLKKIKVLQQKNNLSSENNTKDIQAQQKVNKVKPTTTLIKQDNSLINEKPSENQQKQQNSKALQAQKVIKQLLTLTPQMPKLLHYYKPTFAIQQLNPSNVYDGYFDGCSKRNPGPAGEGHWIHYRQNVVLEASNPLGTKTNNQAEFTGIMFLLVDAYINGIRKINVYGDSKLAIDVINGKKKVSSPNIIDYSQGVKKVLTLFPYRKIEYIQRTYNRKADKLSNMGVKIKHNLQKNIF